MGRRVILTTVAISPSKLFSTPTLLQQKDTFKMNSSKFPILVFFFITILFSTIDTTFAQFVFRHTWCGDTTYTQNSTYQSNRESVLNSISMNTNITYGFYNFSFGQVPNRVSSLALCRGDVPIGTCQVCIRNSAKFIPQTCPNQKEAFGYTEYCMIFISNQSIYGNVQYQNQWSLLNGATVSDISAFNRSVFGLMERLQTQAASGNAEKKFAVGQVNMSDGGGVLYGLVQCTPDLSRSDCVKCVQDSLDTIPTCCIKPGSVDTVRIVVPSCFIQYDTYSFYGNVPDLAPPPLPVSAPPLSSNANNKSREADSKGSRSAIAIVIPVVGAAILIIIAALLIIFRKRKVKKSWVKFNKDEIETLESLQYSLGVIKLATQDFSENNKLGQGGFGSVYKGVLSDGQEIAVKRLLRNSGGQGDVQFKNEILILAKLQHRNLVRLLGFCFHQEEMLLIYEFVANRSLDNFLFDPSQRQCMLWETRYKIIHGIARGLLYLHEESRLRIIHRDLKSGNVLLDSEFNPKIADFGMARLFNIDQTQVVASRIVGTYGYMPPEYVLQGQVSVKSDVFSFGVLVLEIISGQRICSFLDGENPENLLSFAWKSWNNNMAWSVVDPAISAGCITEIMRCIHIGLLCVQENPSERPTMSSIALMLSSSSLSLSVPSQPAFFIESNSQPDVPLQGNASAQFSGKSAGDSVNGMTITEFYPR